jgi:hypothetical protein
MKYGFARSTQSSIEKPHIDYALFFFTPVAAPGQPNRRVLFATLGTMCFTISSIDDVSLINELSNALAAT